MRHYRVGTSSGFFHLLPSSPRQRFSCPSGSPGNRCSGTNYHPLRLRCRVWLLVGCSPEIQTYSSRSRPSNNRIANRCSLLAAMRPGSCLRLYVRRGEWAPPRVTSPRAAHPICSFSAFRQCFAPPLFAWRYAPFAPQYHLGTRWVRPVTSLRARKHRLGRYHTDWAAAPNQCLPPSSPPAHSTRPQAAGRN